MFTLPNIDAVRRESASGVSEEREETPALQEELLFGASSNMQCENGSRRQIWEPLGFNNEAKFCVSGEIPRNSLI